MMLRTTALSGLTVLAVAAAPAYAQDEHKTGAQKKVEDAKKKVEDAKKVEEGPLDAIGLHRRGLLDDSGRPVDGKAVDKVVAEQALRAGPPATAPRVDASAAELRGDHLFEPTAYLRPRRLAPGQSGTLHVVVTLAPGGKVVLPGSVAELRLAPLAGMQFGTPALGEPSRGVRSKKYRGQPVFEDTLVFRVPVTIREGAAHGDHPIAGKVRLALHDGVSGDPQGVFVAPVKGTVRVGAALPVPVAGPRAGLDGGRRGEHASDPAGGRRLEGGPANAPGPAGGERGVGSRSEPAAGSAGGEAIAPGDPASRVESVADHLPGILWWIVLPVVVLLGLFLARRRG